DADSVDAALASLDADGDGVLDGNSNIEYSGTAAAGNLTFMTADGSDLTITETLGGDATGGFTGTLAGGSQTTYGSLDVACNADLELTGADAANAGFTGTTSATYDPTMVEVNNGSFSFNPQGQLAEITRSDGTTVSPEDSTWPNVHISAGNLDWNNGADATQDVTYEMNITQFATDSKVVTQQANGYTSGYLTDLAVDKEGTITATYSNGETRDMARLALGKFSNNNGLEKLGKNLYQATNDSGPADVGMPGSGVGKIFSNSLEQSTVDIAEEFTKMITTQRSFQANSRTITTTDEMLNEVINMKR
ncbi:MAG TPA: flagellar hook-basal body complex protein, partial [Desulfosalsimonadaceae bacterium]|nr:flagellar hook-basal body complex protein [Desulfosalsimonadaceae bacterium]